MRVLLISPNTEMLPDPVFPLGLAFLSGALDRSFHQHRILDLCFADDYGKALEQGVAEFQPEAIGLSLRNVDNVAYPQTCSYLPFYQRVVARLRSLSTAPIILGGSGFSLMPQAILHHLGADYGVIGEGEVTLLRLLDLLERGDSPDLLPGVVSARQPLQAPVHPRPGVDLHQLALPSRQRLASGAYFRLGGMGNVQTKRGCSFSCVYCTYPLIEGPEIRLRPPAQIGKEFEELCAQGIDNLFIVDNIFNFPPHHAKSVCTELVRRRLKVHWSCYLHPGFVTESLLVLMKEAGCTSVEFGVDSGSDILMPQLGKSFRTAEVRRASELCHKVGLPFCHSLIFGGPGETADTIRETLKCMAETSPTAVIAMVGIRLFPGTALARTASPRDLMQTDESVLAPTFYLAEAVRPFVLDLLQGHAETNRHWILPGSHVNINRRIQEKLRRFGVKGPLWEYMQMRRQ